MYCPRCNKKYSCRRNLRIHKCIPSKETLLAEHTSPFQEGPRRWTLDSSVNSLRKILTHYANDYELIDKWIRKGRIYHVIIGNSKPYLQGIMESLYIPISGQRCSCSDTNDFVDHEHYIGYKLPLSDFSVKKQLQEAIALCGAQKKSYKCKPITNIGHFLNVVIYIQRETAGVMEFSRFASRHTHTHHTWTYPHTWKKSTLKLLLSCDSIPLHWLVIMEKHLEVYKNRSKKLILKGFTGVSVTHKPDGSIKLILETA